MTTGRSEQRLIGLVLLSLSGGYLATWWAWPMWMAWAHGSLAVFSLAIIAWRISIEWMPTRVHKAHGIMLDRERIESCPAVRSAPTRHDCRGDSAQTRTAHGQEQVSQRQT